MDVFYYVAFVFGLALGIAVGDCGSDSKYEYGCKTRCEDAGEIFHDMSYENGCQCTVIVKPPGEFGFK